MYSIIELKTNDGETTHHFYTESSKDSAMLKYYTILAEAVTSSVEIHTALVLDAEGRYLARDSYNHPKTEEEKNESITEESDE